MIFNFWSPKAFEPWDYRNPTGPGIGGSETAHIEMALRLAKRGHKVISYSPLPADIPDLNFGGVEWRDLKELNIEDPGIWVISRDAKFIDRVDAIHPKQQYWLVMQDEFYPDLNKKRLDKFDKLLPLSPAHKYLTLQRYYEGNDNPKVVLSANGIRTDVILDILEKNIKPRNYKKLMYASSPDRGLEQALQIFKKAYEIDQKLEFHIYYGFNNIDKTLNKGTMYKYFQAQKDRIVKLMGQPGVINHGRISQLELYSEWASAGIWFYPTNFFETSCITSMESQALGAIPITAPIGALSENVGFGIMIAGEVKYDMLTQCRYAQWLVRMANYPEGQDKIRPQMIQYALKKFDWDNVVDSYIKLGEFANG